MTRWFVRPLVAVVLTISISFGFAAAAGPGQDTTSLATAETAKSYAGTNSRLRPVQHALISDQATWHRVWLSHLGAIDESSASDPVPEVDFSKSQVVAVIERSPTDGSRKMRVVEVKEDDGICFVSFVIETDDSDARVPRAENLFAFFVIPRSDKEVVLLRRDFGSADEPGHEVIEVASFPAAAVDDINVSKPVRLSSRMLNIGFAHEPGSGHYDGVVGRPRDHWNFASTGTTAVDFMRYSDASSSTARLRVSKHDGGWGIKGQFGIYRGYIYHNCQCVDLGVRVLDLPASRYRAIVYAHGDAPDQNAAVELIVGGESRGRKATGNDGTWGFRESPFREGVHFVSFDFAVGQGEEVEFVSHRDGSDYSVFNAIQIVPILDGEAVASHR